MSTATAETLADQLELAETLRLARNDMLEPQDLPGRYGRVIKAIDRVMAAVKCQAVIGGGWAVWRHGYVGRVTQDIDIVIGKDQINDFIRAASVAGFDVLPIQPGHWPKLLHKETQIVVDLLPEGERPGTAAHPAPTTLPHPAKIGAAETSLRYITLPALVELKLGAGRAKDESDVVELIISNADQLDAIRKHLAAVHPDYATTFDRLAERARDQQDR